MKANAKSQREKRVASQNESQSHSSLMHLYREIGKSGKREIGKTGNRENGETGKRKRIYGLNMLQVMLDRC